MRWRSVPNLARASPCSRDQLKLVLTSSSRVLQKRWSISSTSTATAKAVFFIRSITLRIDFPTMPTICARCAARRPNVTVGAPFGLDTILLVSTSEPCPTLQPQLQSVATRGIGPTQSPLERLLSSASSGTRVSTFRKSRPTGPLVSTASKAFRRQHNDRRRYAISVHE